MVYSLTPGLLGFGNSESNTTPGQFGLFTVSPLRMVDLAVVPLRHAVCSAGIVPAMAAYRYRRRIEFVGLSRFREFTA